jgi:hypothetical protein
MHSFHRSLHGKGLHCALEITSYQRAKKRWGKMAMRMISMSRSMNAAAIATVGCMSPTLKLVWKKPPAWNAGQRAWRMDHWARVCEGGRMMRDLQEDDNSPDKAPRCNGWLLP